MEFALKVLSINFSDIAGGAARAAYRLHQALLGAGVDSTMQVVKATSGDWTVSSPQDSLFKLGTYVRPQVAAFVRKLLKSTKPSPISTSVLPSRWPAIINKSDADIIQLHWLCAEMMSVEDIARIKKPVVWTQHDMWAFCGAEHVSDDERWRLGYSSFNRPNLESGIDLNRWVWNRKCRAWKTPFQIVTPSRWLANCARESKLMHDWPISVIPNAIDTDVWKPIDQTFARSMMGLPQDVNLIAFGAMGNGQAPHKGFDLLLESLAYLRGQVPRLEVVIFGQRRPKVIPDIGFTIHYAGHLHDDLSLQVLYNAIDVMIIPSRIDNLPNAGVEAFACGTPVVAFDTCGLPDIVTHQENGYLAKAFDTEDLARGIQWVLADENRLNRLGQAARETATSRFCSNVVAEQYKAIYQCVLDRH